MSNIKVDFDWHIVPLVWGSFNQQEFTELIEKISDFYKIQDDIKEKIHVYCGDNSTDVTSEGTSRTPFAVATPIYDSDEAVINNVRVLFNRTLEEFELGVEKHYSNPDLKSYFCRNRQYSISVPLKEPKELVTWLVGEELNHANFFLKFGAKPGRLDEIAINYLRYSSRILGLEENIDLYGPDNIPLYSQNIIEVTASRQVLLFLEKTAENPDRAKVFRDAYRQSLEKRMVAIPDFLEVYKQTFFRTN